MLRLLSLMIFSLPALWAVTASAAAGEELVDRIVAVVDGEPILFTEVQDKVTKGPLVVVSDYPATESAAPFERALQDAVNFELVLAKAKDMDIEVRDDEVEAEINSFLASRGLDRNGLLQHLGEQGMKYEDYREDFRDQMILRRFQGRVIGPLVKITDKDVETYFLKKSGSTSEVIELVLRQILISVPSGTSEAVAQAKNQLAREVHQKLVGGMSFLDAVKIYSDEGSAREKGGLMAPVKAKDLVTSIRTEVEDLEAGQFTGPVRTAMGFHIFYLEEKKFSGSREFQDRKRQLEMELRTLELGEQTRRWLMEQRQRSKVELLLK